MMATTRQTIVPVLTLLCTLLLIVAADAEETNRAKCPRRNFCHYLKASTEDCQGEPCRRDRSGVEVAGKFSYTGAMAVPRETE
jgi:hypothetical protein